MNNNLIKEFIISLPKLALNKTLMIKKEGNNDLNRVLVYCGEIWGDNKVRKLKRVNKKKVSELSKLMSYEDRIELKKYVNI